MGNKDDCSPETWASAAYGIVTSALAFARREMPEYVSELEKMQHYWAEKLVDLDR